MTPYVIIGRDLMRTTRVSVALVISAGLVVGQGLAAACSCAPPDRADMARAGFPGSEAVFAGKTAAIKYLDPPEQMNPEPRIVVTFDVSRSWKGPADRQIVLHTVRNGWTCHGYYFEVDQEYLVFAHRQEDGTLGTELCTGTASLLAAEEYLPAFGPGVVPDLEPQSEGIRWKWWE